MLLLSLDTSGAAVSVALHDGGAMLAQESRFDARHHAELLAPLVVRVLAAAGAHRRDVTAIAVGVGPGPFTGLRVGLVTARVLGYTLGVPVHGVCSLDALAEATVTAGQLAAGSPFLVATDARRREVYWARYGWVGPAAAAARLSGPAVQAPAEVPRAGLPVVGRGAAAYPDLLGEPVGPLDVTAAAVAALAVRVLGGSMPAGGGVLLPPTPLYLRRPDAVEPGARKRVRARPGEP